MSASIRGSSAEVPKAIALTVGALLLITAGLVFSPQLVLTDMPGDLPIPLDGAWRMYAGQRPHVDFITPIGDLYYVLLGAGAALTGASPRLLLVANAIAALATLPLAWWATRGRLPEPLRGLAIAAPVLLALSPRTLDSAAQLGFNAMYNRWAWTLVLLAALLALLPVEAGLPSRRRVDASLLALLLVLTFWTKVTFVPLFLVIVACSWLVVPERIWSTGAGAALGLAGIGVSLLTARGAAYLADLRLVAEAASGGPGLLRADYLVKALQQNQPEILLGIGLMFTMIRSADTEAEQQRASRVALAAVGVALASMLIASQNHDTTVPLFAVGTLMILATVRTYGDPRHLSILGVLAFGQLGLAAMTEARAILSHVALGFGETLPLYDDAASPLSAVRIPKLDGTNTQIDLVLEDGIPGTVFDNLTGTSWPNDTTVILADATRLLDAHGERGRRVASLTFSPFFPYMNGSPPPRGLLAWWDWERTAGESWDQHACASFADTEIVLEPKVWIMDGIHEEYAACLAAEFQKVDESKLWILWERRP